MLQGLEQVLAGRSSLFEWEYPCRRTGKPKWCLVQIVPLAQGGALMAHTNITRTKQAQQALSRRLRSLASQLTLCEARERERIAASLHDELQQLLVACNLQIQLAYDARSGDVDPAAIQQAKTYLRDALAFTRTLSRELSPGVSEHAHLGDALAVLVDQTRRRLNLQVQYHDDGLDKPLREVKRFLLYEAVRELLLNVVKHAQAKSVNVELSRDNNLLRILVQDDGRGCDAAEALAPAKARDSFGLFHIRERLRDLQGDLQFDGSPGDGCRVTLTVPVDAEHG